MNITASYPADKNPKKIFFKDQVFYIFDQVYEPAEDTFLIAENLNMNSGDTVLEVGSGCGILSVLSASKAKRVIAIDINPHAARCTRTNARINNVSDKVDVIRGDLFGPLREENLFDLILFNAPYLPTGKSEPIGWIDYAWEGGETGRKVIDRFIESAARYLKPRGRILLVQSTLSDVNKTLKRLEKQGFKVETKNEHKVAFETITLIEAHKPCK